jgi:hypothetical protein
MGIIFSSKKGGKRNLRYCFDMNFINANILFYKVPHFFRFLHQQVGFVTFFGGSEVLLFDKFTILCGIKFLFGNFYSFSYR